MNAVGFLCLSPPTVLSFILPPPPWKILRHFGKLTVVLWGVRMKRKRAGGGREWKRGRDKDMHCKSTEIWLWYKHHLHNMYFVILKSLTYFAINNYLPNHNHKICTFVLAFSWSLSLFKILGMLWWMSDSHDLSKRLFIWPCAWMVWFPGKCLLWKSRLWWKKMQWKLQPNWKRIRLPWIWWIFCRWEKLYEILPMQQ